MILVDTSVLIDYLKGRSHVQTDRFDEVRIRKIPFGINNYIYQELLQGAAADKDFQQLREYLGTLPFYELKHGKRSHEMAARLYFRCRKKGVTIRSTVDFLIAQTAIENDLLLLHNDADFTAMGRIIRELKLY